MFYEVCKRDYSQIPVHYKKVNVKFMICYKDYTFETYEVDAEFMHEFIDKVGDKNINRVIAWYGGTEHYYEDKLENVWIYRPSEYGTGVWKNMKQVAVWQELKHPDWVD